MQDMALIHWQVHDYGVAQCVSLTRLECDLILQGCERMLQHHSEQAALAMIDQQTVLLRQRARQGDVGPQWVAQAVMLLCLRGLLGENILSHCVSSH